MSSRKNKKIKAKLPISAEKQIKVGKTPDSNSKCCFSFESFNGKSVKVGKSFNNFYADRDAAEAVVSDFFSKLKSYSSMRLGDIISGRERFRMHCKQINRNEEVGMINMVLREGYNVPDGTIEQYDGEYHEIGLANGGRLIAVKDQNVFRILFVDCNHLISAGSSRLKEAKSNYGYPAMFEIDESNRDNSDKQTSIEYEFMQMVMGGRYKSIKELKNDYVEYMGLTDET